MRKLEGLSWGEWVEKSHIDAALSDRDPEFLTSLICTEGLGAEVKEHLVNVIFDLLTGKRKFPRRRPKKSSYSRKSELASLSGRPSNARA